MWKAEAEGWGIQSCPLLSRSRPAWNVLWRERKKASFAQSLLFLGEGKGHGGASSKDLSQWLQRPSSFPKCQPSLTWTASLISGNIEKMPHSAQGPLVAPKQSLCLFHGPPKGKTRSQVEIGCLTVSRGAQPTPLGGLSRQKSECTPNPCSSDKPASGSLAPAMSSLGQHSAVGLQLLHAEPTAEAQGRLSDLDRFCLCTNSCSPAQQLCHPGEVPARGPAL